MLVSIKVPPFGRQLVEVSVFTTVSRHSTFSRPIYRGVVVSKFRQFRIQVERCGRLRPLRYITRQDVLRICRLRQCSSFRWQRNLSVRATRLQVIVTVVVKRALGRRQVYRRCPSTIHATRLDFQDPCIIRHVRRGLRLHKMIAQGAFFPIYSHCLMRPLVGAIQPERRFMYICHQVRRLNNGDDLMVCFVVRPIFHPILSKINRRMRLTIWQDYRQFRASVFGGDVLGCPFFLRSIVVIQFTNNSHPSLHSVPVRAVRQDRTHFKACSLPQYVISG